MKTLFTALLPDDRFAASLTACKAQVRELAGSQLYLDHLPHLTLYLAAFENAEMAAGRIRDLVSDLKAPGLTVTGWHVFEADTLTGRNTLVCDLSPVDRSLLRTLQERVVAELSGLRSPLKSQELFEGGRSRFSAAEWTDVVNVGFPYLGLRWHPHFTVASIAAADWDKVWEQLEPGCPTGPVTCPALGLYEQGEDKPRLVELLLLPPP